MVDLVSSAVLAALILFAGWVGFFIHARRRVSLLDILSVIPRDAAVTPQYVFRRLVRRRRSALFVSLGGVHAGLRELARQELVRCHENENPPFYSSILPRETMQ
jgi:hypothetical protein